MFESPSASPSLTWPLTGREAELQRIAAARGDATTRGIVLNGGAGVGKSRLAREALDAAEADGALIAWVAATRSAAAVPFGAFAALIPDDARSDEPLELMRRSVDALREQAGGRRVVLGVDDAQLLDPVSAALVLHLALTETAFVLATVRTGEPCPDAIVSLWKDGLARRLDLDRLSAASTAALVEAAVGGPVEQAALQWVCESSEGNALYVRELVLGALDAGLLTEAGDLWRLSRRPDVSRPLAELVAERMAGLTDDERRPLELLALGEPMRTAEIVALTGSDSLMAAEARGMAVVVPGSGGSEVRLAHPLYGEVMRQDLPALRARDLRRRLAATVRERVPLVPGDALRVARWLLDAGEPIPVALLVDAARAANLAGDPELGALLAEQAIADGAGLEASLLLARSFAVRKQFDEAEKVLARVEGAVDEQDTALEYLEQRAVTVQYWGLKQPDEALALIERAQEWWPEQAWQRRLDPLRLHLASLVDGFAGAITVSDEILADPELDPQTRRQLEPVHALNLFYVGRMRDAHALNRRILPTVPLRDHADAIALSAWSILGMESGLEWPALFTYMAEMLQDGVRANDHEAAGIAALTLGGLTWFQGRFAEARRWLAEAELHLEQKDTFGQIAGARATMVGVALFTGDLDGVEAAIARCRATPAWDAPLPSLRPYVVRTEAWAAYGAGDRRGAQTMLLDAAADMPEMPAYAAPLTYEALRLGGSPTRIAPLLAELAERCDAPMPVAYALHGDALAADDGAALLAVADAMEAFGGLQYGMEAAAAAVPIFLKQGRQDSARRAAARARELHQDGQGGPPLQFDGLDAAAVALTTREAQLVALASRGLSNAEIADRLVLSVRTVESHIYRAMQKLGVNDRRDL